VHVDTRGQRTDRESAWINERSDTSTHCGNSWRFTSESIINCSTVPSPSDPQSVCLSSNFTPLHGHTTHNHTIIVPEADLREWGEIQCVILNSTPLRKSIKLLNLPWHPPPRPTNPSPRHCSFPAGSTNYRLCLCITAGHNTQQWSWCGASPPGATQLAANGTRHCVYS
jgi:hypothetical protein